MKPALRFVGIATAFLLFLTAARSQWTQVNGPVGGGVNCLADNGTYAFASVMYAGLYRSSNHGADWVLIKKLPWHRSIMAMAALGTHLFISIEYQGIFHSSDNGVTWSEAADTRMESGFPDPDINAFAVSGTRIYAGTSSGSIFYSDDHGATWRRGGLISFGGRFWIKALLAQGTTLYAVGESGVCRSSDRGMTWAPVGGGLPSTTAWSSIAAEGTTVYIATRGHGVYRSTDQGRTWSAVTTGLNGQGSLVNALMTFGKTVYAGTDYGVYRSVNNGDTWQAAPSDVEGSRILSLAASPTRLYAGLHIDGLMVSDTSGTWWTLSSSGMINPQIPALAFSGAKLIAGTRHGVSLSTDNGLTWTHAPTIANSFDVRSLIVVGKNLFAGGDDFILRSSDDGVTWSPVVLPTPMYMTVTTFASVGPVIFAAGMGGKILRSKDDGLTWEYIFTHVGSPTTGSLAVSGGDLFATTPKGVIVSSDQGESWTQMPGLPLMMEEWVSGLTVAGPYVFISTDDQGVFRSEDRGATWKAVNDKLGGAKLAAFEGTVFAGMGNRIFVSQDFGDSWQEAGDGLTQDVEYFTVAWPNLYAGTDLGGLWRRPIGEMIRWSPARTSRLSQNFPNPFNGSTTISFVQVSSGHVTLNVYDMLGREVAVLVSGEQPAGTYRYQWNASGMPSGVYCYQLSVGGLTTARKLLLLK